MSAKPVIVERIEAQVKAAKAAVKRSPNDATAHAQLGIAYQQLDLNRHEGGTMQARTRARACGHSHFDARIHSSVDAATLPEKVAQYGLRRMMYHTSYLPG